MLLISPQDEEPERLMRHLQSQRIEVALARSVGEALDQHAPADAVFLELSTAKPELLPEELATLRAARIAPHALAAIAPVDDLELRVEAARAGADMFLVEPLGRQALRDATQQLLEHNEAPRPRVLVIDDDPDFALLAETLLARAGVLAVGVTDSQLSLESLRKLRPDAVLIDFEMPRYHGLELTKMLRSSREFLNTPIIFLSARDESAATREAFAVGADDFLVKPIDASDLVLRVRARIERSRQLRLAAEKDPLTGALNRRAFVAALESRLASSIRNCTGLSLCLLDLDSFKKLNDNHGHLMGDRVLAALGDLLQSQFRAEDVKCRWGGEEFALVFPGDHTPQAVHALITRLLARLMEIEFRGEDGETLSTSFSAGIAHYVPHSADPDWMDVDGLVQIADGRLYLAKRRGRARVVSTDPASPE